MRLVCVALVLLLGASAQASAEEFPMRQDGAARESFVKAQRDGCQQGITYAPMVAFCNCYALALADSITREEYDALSAGQISDSLHKKLREIGGYCKAEYFR